MKTGSLFAGGLMGKVRKGMRAWVYDFKALAGLPSRRWMGHLQLRRALRRLEASGDAAIAAASRLVTKLQAKAEHNDNALMASSATNLVKIASLIDALEVEHKSGATELRKMLVGWLGLKRASSHRKVTTRLAYLANSPFPMRTANNVHMARICSALVSLGYNPLLIALKSDEAGELPSDLFQFFGARPFDIALIESAGNSKLDGILLCKEGLRHSTTHFLGRSLVGCYAAALAGMPTLFEHHTPIRDGLEPVAKDLFRLPQFRGLVVISHALEAHYLETFPLLAHRILVVPDAADPPRSGEPNFELAEIDGTSLQVGYAGHLYPGKGAEIIVLLAERLKHIGFHVLGGYDDDLAFWRVRAEGLPNIVFYGFHPPSEVSAFLSKLDVAIAPYLREVQITRGTREVAAWMSPLKLFEYMAHGLPIVSSDLPVLREVLVNKSNALLCAPDNIDDWVDAIERLETDASLRERLGREAKRDYDAHYSWEKRVERILAPLLGRSGDA